MASDLAVIKGLLEQQEGDYDYGWFFWLYESDGGEFFKLNDDYMARTVRSIGGSEGSGEYLEIVVEVSPRVDETKKFSMESRFFKKLGSYLSFNGAEFDGPLFEVFPKQKTITVYEKD